MTYRLKYSFTKILKKNIGKLYTTNMFVRHKNDTCYAYKGHSLYILSICIIKYSDHLASSGGSDKINIRLMQSIVNNKRIFPKLFFSPFLVRLNILQDRLGSACFIVIVFTSFLTCTIGGNDKIINSPFCIVL